MKRIIVASNNAHKVEEIKAILEPMNYKVVSLKEAGINVDVEENGKTFMENAEIKARAIHKIVNDENTMVLSDDSGLSVDALNGAPGIYSARFSGPKCDSIENNKKLINELKDVPYEERTAKFLCAMVLIVNENEVIKVQGDVKGIILEEYKEEKDAFGYDPLFYVPEYKATFSQLKGEVKNSISHRGNALKKLQEAMKNIK